MTVVVALPQTITIGALAVAETDAALAAKKARSASVSGPSADGGSADRKYVKYQKIVGHDVMPYGMEANLPTIKFLEDTAFKQELTPKRMSIEELFVDPEKL